MGTWRTTVQTDYVAPGGPGFSTFHFRDDADGGLEDALQVATNALKTAYTAVAAGLPAAVLHGTEGRWVEVNTQEIVDVDGWSQRGLISSVQDALPGMTQLCVGWGTAVASKSGRGRTFLAGWGEPANQDGVPTAATLSAGRAFGAAIVDFNATIGNGSFGVYSPTYELMRDITRSAVKPKWASLRSRRD